MGQLAEQWGRHMAGSSVTTIVEDARAGVPMFTITADDFATMVISELSEMHRLVLDLANAVDDLRRPPTP